MSNSLQLHLLHHHGILCVFIVAVEKTDHFILTCRSIFLGLKTSIFSYVCNCLSYKHLVITIQFSGVAEKSTSFRLQMEITVKKCRYLLVCAKHTALFLQPTSFMRIRIVEAVLFCFSKTFLQRFFTNVNLILSTQFCID